MRFVSALCLAVSLPVVRSRSFAFHRLKWLRQRCEEVCIHVRCRCVIKKHYRCQHCRSHVAQNTYSWRKCAQFSVWFYETRCLCRFSFLPPCHAMPRRLCLFYRFLFSFMLLLLLRCLLLLLLFLLLRSLFFLFTWRVVEVWNVYMRRTWQFALNRKFNWKLSANSQWQKQ